MTIEEMRELRSMLMTFMACEATFAEQKLLGQTLRIIQMRIDEHRKKTREEGE